jgi:hypothetical protein
MRSPGRPSVSARAADSSAERLRALRVLVHQAREQLLVEAAPVDADAHGLGVPAGDRDHRRKLLVAFRAAADVAGIDAVLRERAGAFRVLLEQLVPVEMEVAHERYVASRGVQPLADRRDRGRRFDGVDGDAHELGPGAREIDDLARGARDVGRVGVRHRLHDDGRAAADGDAADSHLPGLAPRRRNGARAHRVIAR